MQYFKVPQNKVRAIDEGQEFLIKTDWIEMTAAEVEAHINPPKSKEQLQEEENAKARDYLFATDWYVIRKAETGVAIPDDISLNREKARLQVKEI